MPSLYRLSDFGLTSEEIQPMVIAMDTDGDAKITLEEFLHGYDLVLQYNIYEV